MWSFLKLLCKSDCLFDVEKPSLCCFFVSACVYLFIGLLDGEIEELLLHVKGHIFLLNYLETV